MSSDGVALLLTAAAASAILYLARRRRLQPPKKAQPIAPDTSKIKLQTTPDELLLIVFERTYAVQLYPSPVQLRRWTKDSCPSACGMC